MKKIISVIIVILSLLLSQTVVAANEEIDFKVKLQRLEYENTQFYSLQKNVLFGFDGYFFIRRIDYKTDEHQYVTAFWMPGKEGTLQYFNQKKELVTTPLKDGTLPMNSVLYLETESYSMILGQAYNYIDIGSGTRICVEENRKPVTVKQVGDRWLITYTFEKEIGNHGIMWGVGSRRKLLDLDDPYILSIWSNYGICQSKERLLEDGYYYKSPSSYEPTDENAFWRIPSMYFINSLIRIEGCLGADLIGNAMLMIASENVNEQGYFPTLPQSNWLQSDYDIGPGFFDTRFNADTGITYLLAYQRFKQPVYREVYLSLAEYNLEHIRNEHYLVTDSEGKEGWLVEDYGYQDSKNSHVALNHQLQTMHMLLLMYEEEQDERYLEYALLMLQGIKNTRDSWIMENDNLEYGYMSDGTMGLVDYPYLTYNDLYNVQKDLLRITGKRDDDLDILMYHKKLWMNKNGVTGYIK